MIEKSEYKGIYKVLYFPNEYADDVHITDQYLRPKVFEGVIENFYPGGKCVFYNKTTKQLLVVSYKCIRCIYPISK